MSARREMGDAETSALLWELPASLFAGASVAEVQGSGFVAAQPSECVRARHTCLLRVAHSPSQRTAAPCARRRGGSRGGAHGRVEGARVCVAGGVACPHALRPLPPQRAPQEQRPRGADGV